MVICLPTPKLTRHFSIFLITHSTVNVQRLSLVQDTKDIWNSTVDGTGEKCRPISAKLHMAYLLAVGFGCIVSAFRHIFECSV